jgi:hypothetical protein
VTPQWLRSFVMVLHRPHIGRVPPLVLILVGVAGVALGAWAVRGAYSPPGQSILHFVSLRRGVVGCELVSGRTSGDPSLVAVITIDHSSDAFWGPLSLIVRHSIRTSVTRTPSATSAECWADADVVRLSKELIASDLGEVPDALRVRDGGKVTLDLRRLRHALGYTLVLLFCGVLLRAIWLVIKATRLHANQRGGRCIVCSYDLRGVRGLACPECGSRIKPADAAVPRDQHEAKNAK